MNDVVQDIDPDQFSRFGKSFGHLPIFVTWIGIARGVIVGKHDRRRSFDHGRFEYFARVNERRIERANRDDDDALNSMFGI